MRVQVSPTLIKKNIIRQKGLSEEYLSQEEESKMFKVMTANSILSLSTWKKVLGSDVLTFSGGVSKIRKVCRVTGRSRGVLSDYQVSRIKWKEIFNRGLISGSRKSSW